MENKTENLKKSVIDSVFEHRVGQAIAIVLATVGLLSFFNSPIQANENKIKEVAARVEMNEKIVAQNQQTQSAQLIEIKILINNLDKKLIENCEKVSVIEAILSERLPLKK